MFDKIFKVGILLIGVGFLFGYVYNGRPASAHNDVPCNRYSMMTAAGNDRIHTVYMLDTQEGSLYYAMSSPENQFQDKPLRWKEAK